MSSSSRRIHTKEMICCIILIVVGCLTSFSYSTAVSASNRSSSNAAIAAIHRNADRTNFNGNGILRDDDVAQQQSIGNIAVAIPASASTLESHKKHINGGNSATNADDDFNVNGPNDNGAHSPHDANYFNRFDEGDTNDNNNDDDDNEGTGNADHDDSESSDFISIEVDDQLSLKDQMRLFTEQMTKRFHRELNAAVRKTTKKLYETDFQSQLEQLR